MSAAPRYSSFAELAKDFAPGVTPGSGARFSQHSGQVFLTVRNNAGTPFVVIFDPITATRLHGDLHEAVLDAIDDLAERGLDLDGKPLATRAAA